MILVDGRRSISQNKVFGGEGEERRGEQGKGGERGGVIIGFDRVIGSYYVLFVYFGMV